MNISRYITMDDCIVRWNDKMHKLDNKCCPICGRIYDHETDISYIHKFPKGELECMK